MRIFPCKTGWGIRTLALLLLAGILISMTACSRGAKSMVIGYDLPGSPRTLDPQIAEDAASHQVIRSMFEGLLDLDATGNLVPAAAESYSISNNGLTYTFRVREDAQWTYSEEDGSDQTGPVTADDFVFAFDRLFTPNTNASAASRFSCIRGASAILAGEAGSEALGVYADSAQVLRFELDTTNDNFLRLLTTTYAMPCNEAFFLRTRGRYGLEKETALSNGAFRLSKWESGVSIQLVKNAQYRAADEVKPDAIRLYLGANSGVQDEDAGSLKRLSDMVVNAALLDGGANGVLDTGFQTEPIENAVWGLCVNFSNAALANEHIRQALAMTFDRSVYQAGLPEHLVMAYALLPHDVLLSDSTFRKGAGEQLAAAFDPDAAYERYKQGLAELGKTSTGELRLLMEKDAGVPAASLFSNVSQVLQRELSLYIKVEEVESGEYALRLASGDFDLALCKYQSSDSTPWPILSAFSAGNPSNYGGYSNAEFDAALAAAEIGGGGEASDSEYIRAEKLLLDDAAFLPMFYSTDYFVTRADTHGLVYNKWTGMVDFRGGFVE